MSFIGNGNAREVTKRGRVYSVKPVSAKQAAKEYVCPGCLQKIAAGVAHLVVWQADDIFGDAAAIAARRHWHVRCWEVA
ncbi:MAG: hypothetical protein Q4C71_01620 [Microbacteriaceae bacterium]|nr:hypothetical protein [Microbacteriaceae bacterium]